LACECIKEVKESLEKRYEAKEDIEKVTDENGIHGSGYASVPKTFKTNRRKIILHNTKIGIAQG